MFQSSQHEGGDPGVHEPSPLGGGHTTWAHTLGSELILQISKRTSGNFNSVLRIQESQKSQKKFCEVMLNYRSGLLEMVWKESEFPSVRSCCGGRAGRHEGRSPSSSAALGRGRQISVRKAAVPHTPRVPKLPCCLDWRQDAFEGPSGMKAKDGSTWLAGLVIL